MGNWSEKAKERTEIAVEKIVRKQSKIARRRPREGTSEIKKVRKQTRQQSKGQRERKKKNWRQRRKWVIEQKVKDVLNGIVTYPFLSSNYVNTIWHSCRVCMSVVKYAVLFCVIINTLKCLSHTTFSCLHFLWAHVYRSHLLLNAKQLIEMVRVCLVAPNKLKAPKC